MAMEEFTSLLTSEAIYVESDVQKKNSSSNEVSLAFNTSRTNDEILGGTDENLDGIDEILGRTNDRFDGTDEILGGTDEQLDGIDKKLDGIDEKIGSGVFGHASEGNIGSL
ncbi:hypothetical protein U1Q18_029114 [Sarracenia purpurea var. burkii]